MLHTPKRVLLAVVLYALEGLLFAQGQRANRAPSREKNVQSSNLEHKAVLRDLDQAMDEVAERVLPAVVQISVSGFGPSRGRGSSENVIERQRGVGSGVIVDPSGYVITNAHVVTGAQRIQVVMRSVNTELVPGKTSLLHKQRTFEAKLIGTHRLTDLALLKIDAADLPAIPLKDEYKARLGQTVLAVGSPAGLDHTVTKGIISALGRQTDLDHPMIYIQTDAPINPGNSGGALVDRDGGLVGINTFIYSQGGGSEGLGFAIPEPTVRFVYEELKRYGRVRQTLIGASAQTITPTLAAGLKLPQDWGVVVSDVVPGGPADKAGLKSRDIVAAVDKREIDSLPKFAASLFLHRHDQAVEMDVLRGTETLKLYIPAVEAEGGVESLADLIDPQNGLIQPLGIFVLDLKKPITDMLPDLRSSSGVVVAGRVDYTPPVDTDLASGDVICSLNGIRLPSASHLRSELGHFKTGDPVVLEVERQGRFQFVSFVME
jgi:serine protease Do